MNPKIVIIGSAAILYIGYKVIENFRTKSGTSSLIKQLKKDTATEDAFAESLDILVKKSSINNSDSLKELDFYLNKDKNNIGKFRIHYINKLSEDRYLFVTTSDYEESFKAGKRKVEVSDVYNLNFVLKIDVSNNQYLVTSDFHTDLVDKNLRSDFANSLFALLQSS